MDTHDPPKIQPIPTVEAGQEALSRAEWKEARSAFEGVLQTEESPEAFEGLGIAAWWLEDDVIAQGIRARAVALGRSLGNIDLEMLALAYEGFALVDQGKIAEGMR